MPIRPVAPGALPILRPPVFRPDNPLSNLPHNPRPNHGAQINGSRNFRAPVPRPSTNTQIRTPLQITAKQVLAANGIEFHLTNTTGAALPENVIPQVMQLVHSRLEEARRDAILRRRPVPTEVTFDMDPEILRN